MTKSEHVENSVKNFKQSEENPLQFGSA